MVEVTMLPVGAGVGLTSLTGQTVVMMRTVDVTLPTGQSVTVVGQAVIVEYSVVVIVEVVMGTVVVPVKEVEETELRAVVVPLE